MSNRLRLISLTFLAAGLFQPLYGQSLSQPQSQLQPDIVNIDKGKSIASQQCQACHGDTVIPHVSQYPNLKGQKASYLLKQLQAFQSGKRQDLFMQAQTQHLTTQDMINVTAYYASLQPDNLKAIVERYAQPKQKTQQD